MLFRDWRLCTEREHSECIQWCCFEDCCSFSSGIKAFSHRTMLSVASLKTSLCACEVIPSWVSFTYFPYFFIYIFQSHFNVSFSPGLEMHYQQQTKRENSFFIQFLMPFILSPSIVNFIHENEMRYYLIMYLEWRAVQRIKIAKRKHCNNKFIHTAFSSLHNPFYFVNRKRALHKQFRFVFLLLDFIVRCFPQLNSIYKVSWQQFNFRNFKWTLMERNNAFMFYVTFVSYWWIKNHESHCVYECLS